MIAQITIGIASLGVLFIAWRVHLRIKNLQKELKTSQSKLTSAYVKFGKSFEHFVPFTKDFEGDIEKTVFLGMPIDFICFDKDAVKFIEVKTGQAKLSPKQNFIRKQIEQGKVKFIEVRY